MSGWELGVRGEGRGGRGWGVRGQVLIMGNWGSGVRGWGWGVSGGWFRVRGSGPGGGARFV